MTEKEDEQSLHKQLKLFKELMQKPSSEAPSQVSQLIM